MSRSKPIIPVFIILLFATIAVILVMYSYRYNPPPEPAKSTQLATGTNTTRSGRSIVESYEYRLAVSLLEEITKEERKLYPNSTGFNIRVVNETILVLNNTRYQYLILYAYDPDRGLSLHFKNISVDGIRAEYIAPERNVTYTGLRPINYLVYIGNMTCKATFWTISYAEISTRITVQVFRICDNAYSVRYTLAREPSIAHTSVLGLIMVKPGEK